MQFQNNKRKKIYSFNRLKYMSKKIIIPFMTVFLMSSILYANEDMRALEMINEARAANHLSILQYSKILEEAAQNHANYLAYHQKIGHKENEDLPFFTGEYAGDRALFVNYLYNILSENIAYTSIDSFWQDATTSLFISIYHRFGFLQRNLYEIGYAYSKEKEGKKEKKFVFLLGSPKKYQTILGYYIEIWDTRINYLLDTITINNDNTSKKNTMILYPWPNQQNFHPVFYDKEIPDPTPFSKSGNPISVQFDSSTYHHIEIISFSLTDASGKQLEIWELNSENDVNKIFSPFDFAWFPLQPLQWDSQYSVQLKYKADGGEVQEKKWSFKTKTKKSQ